MKQIFLFVFLLFLFGCIFAPKFEKEEVLIERVIDGDTVRLFGGESVRLIGINSTERGEECYKEAKDYLTELVEGKIILLEKDIEERDKYDRLLGYIYVEGVKGEKEVFLNLEMVESGNAYAYEYEPNVRYSFEFAIAEEKARLQKQGCLWAN